MTFVLWTGVTFHILTLKKFSRKTLTQLECYYAFVYNYLTQDQDSPFILLMLKQQFN